MSDIEFQILDLPARFTAMEANNTKKFLNKAFTRYDAITLNGDKILQIDISGMQLLLAFTRELDNRGMKWNWLTPSDVLLETAIEAGMIDALKILENAK